MRCCVGIYSMYVHAVELSFFSPAIRVYVGMLPYSTRWFAENLSIYWELLGSGVTYLILCNKAHCHRITQVISA